MKYILALIATGAISKTSSGLNFLANFWDTELDVKYSTSQENVSQIIS
jgi:hypothetical protein